MLVGFHRLPVNQLVDFGVAVAAIIAIGAANVCFVEFLVRFVEPALGWIPFYLHSMDDKLERRGYVFPHITEKPSFWKHWYIV